MSYFFKLKRNSVKSRILRKMEEQSNKSREGWVAFGGGGAGWRKKECRCFRAIIEFWPSRNLGLIAHQEQPKCHLCSLKWNVCGQDWHEKAKVLCCYYNFFVYHLSLSPKGHCYWGRGGGEGPLVHVGMCMFLLVCWVSILALKGYILYNVLKLVVSKSWLPDITN